MAGGGGYTRFVMTTRTLTASFEQSGDINSSEDAKIYMRIHHLSKQQSYTCIAKRHQAGRTGQRVLGAIDFGYEVELFIYI